MPPLLRAAWRWSCAGWPLRGLAAISFPVLPAFRIVPFAIAERAGRVQERPTQHPAKTPSARVPAAGLASVCPGCGESVARTWYQRSDLPPADKPGLARCVERERGRN